MINYQTPYQPEDVGYDGSRFNILNKHFEKMIEKDQLQGATYCLSRDGKVFAHAAIGRYCYRPEDTRELTPDHLHHIASITKLFTAVAIFKLYEDGQILIGQKVSEILDEFKEPPYNNITIGNFSLILQACSRMVAVSQVYIIKHAGIMYLTDLKKVIALG